MIGIETIRIDLRFGCHKKGLNLGLSGTRRQATGARKAAEGVDSKEKYLFFGRVTRDLVVALRA